MPRLAFSLDPLMAEAKRRARRRRLLLALGVAAGGAVAVTLALQSSAGPGGAPSAAATAGAGSGGAALNEGPVLAGGVAPVTGGRVVASVTPDSGKVGTRVRLTQIATAPIDASGNFVLRPDPTSRVLAPTIVEAITNNSSWVNLQLFETGADGKMAITSIARQYVDVSGKPLSLAEFRAAPGSGHWIGDGTGGTMVDPRYEVALPSSQGAHR
ncbi:MAG TPA: hypothetical protein VGM45_05710 [Gaiellaceae bacterium]